MYKNKRSGAIGTVIAVIVLILLVILTNLNRDNLSYAESFVTSIIMPVQNAFTMLGHKVKGDTEFFTNLDTLKKENEELKKAIKNNVKMPFDIPLCTIIENEEISDEELEKVIDELEDLTDEKQDMEIISLLSRSKKRLEVLESLENENKIPSIISKDINDSSHHISKYLKTLKESGLVVCLNENDKRYRYYSITPKGTKYLNIVKNKK